MRSTTEAQRYGQLLVMMKWYRVQSTGYNAWRGGEYLTFCGTRYSVPCTLYPTKTSGT